MGSRASLRGRFAQAPAAALLCGALCSVPAWAMAAEAEAPPAEAAAVKPASEPAEAESAKAPAPTQREAEAIAFAHALTERAVGILGNPQLESAARREAFRALVIEAFDVDAIARMLLGYHVGTVDERRLAQYEGIVADYLVPIYAASIYRIVDRTPEVPAVKETGTEVLLRTSFSRDHFERPVVVDWRLRPLPEGGFRIIDMAENGVSLGLAKRDEFEAVISNQGFDAFLELLHEQAGQGLPEPMSSAVKPGKTRSGEEF